MSVKKVSAKDVDTMDRALAVILDLVDFLGEEGTAADLSKKDKEVLQLVKVRLLEVVGGMHLEILNLKVAADAAKQKKKK